MEVITEFFTNGDFWAVVIKVLTTAVLSASLGLIGTTIGRVIANAKDSKIRKYAKTCVEAAEQKFPNEGKKMGPEKMTYVMDQLAIKFPKIKENTYFYNIVEAAVLELNKDLQKEAAIKEFEKKYGEKPLAVLEEEETMPEEIVEDDVQEDTITTNEIDLSEESKTSTPTEEETTTTTSTTKSNRSKKRLNSF